VASMAGASRAGFFPPRGFLPSPSMGIQEDDHYS
jgi:hypothetical protein